MAYEQHFLNDLKISKMHDMTQKTTKLNIKSSQTHKAKQAQKNRVNIILNPKQHAIHYIKYTNVIMNHE